jgi:hypothetical protein
LLVAAFLPKIVVASWRLRYGGLGNLHNQQRDMNRRWRSTGEALLYIGLTS